MPALALCPLARGAAPVAPSRRPSVAARAEADATAAAPAGKGAIRIKLKSFNKTLITESAAAIVGVARETGASFSGPVPLPTRRRIYTLLRSPHVNKDSREQFETRTHSRLVDITAPTAATVDKLMNLDLPAGVDVSVVLT